MAELTAPRPSVKVRYYRMRNRLKDKAAGLGGNDALLELDAAAMMRAEELLSAASEDYPDWALKTVDELARQHQICVSNRASCHEAFDYLRRAAHDLKGQGATFGYPLVTHIAQSLHQFVSPSERPTDVQLDIIKAHIDAMRAVLRERVRGDGGAIGKALMMGLDAAIQKGRNIRA
jgi:chemotaxis protein histidine kinase CheA